MALTASNLTRVSSKWTANRIIFRSLQHWNGYNAPENKIDKKPRLARKEIKFPFNYPKKTLEQAVADEIHELNGFYSKLLSFDSEGGVVKALHAVIPNQMGNIDFQQAQSKFEVLSACAKEMDLMIPNRQLSSINSLDDVCAFYTNKKTAIETRLAALAFQKNYPPNLQIVY